MAIAISVTACGGEPDVTEIGWECGFEEPEAATDEKLRLAKYHGFRDTTNSPCYSTTLAHSCRELPYTKTFTWHWGESAGAYWGQLWPEDYEALDGFFYAIEYLNNQNTGFSFTYVTQPTGLPNDIPIDWSWNPSSGSYASGGCVGAFAFGYSDVPGAVTHVDYFKNCSMNLNVPKMAMVAATWANQGYDTTPWGVGWAVANHEFGHIMGFAHSQTGGMKSSIPVSELEAADYTAAQYQVMTFYSPTNMSSFTLSTIDGFTPVTSE